MDMRRFVPVFARRRSRWGSFARGAASILGTALVYFAAARLALLMAIPPGYATAVWPAAGLALAAALRFGRCVSAGVLLGSFAANGLVAYSHLPPVFAASVAALIGAGAALQTLVGAGLVLRYVEEPVVLASEKDILKFCVVGGPLSCLVNATWANTALLVAGIVPAGRLPIAWATWWVGDVIGVVLFAPLALILAHGEPPWRRRRIPIGVSLLVAFGLVTTLFVQVSRWEQARLDARMARRCETVAHAIDARLAEAMRHVDSVAAFLSARPDVSSDVFRVFTRWQLTGAEGIQALSWNPRVDRDERERWEDRARRSRSPGFQITECGLDGGLVPALRRERHVVVHYIEPSEGNEHVLGFDIASDPVRAEAIERAEATARPAMTGPIRLVQDGGEQIGVLVLSPAYHRNDDPRTPPRLSGFGAGVLRIEEVVSAVLRSVAPAGVELTIEDEGAPPGARLLYGAREGAPMKWRTSIEAGGRTWTVALASTGAEPDQAAIWSPWAVLAGGLFCVGLLGVLLLVLLGRAAQQEMLAAERANLVEELRAAVVLRDEFLAVAAHELRTPLTTLQLQLQLAGRSPGTPGTLDAGRRLEMAIRQSDRLSRLVDDLLCASRVTMGRLALTREACDLVEIAADTIAQKTGGARRAGCTIELVADAPARGFWDRARLEQVVTNLLANALKFGAGKPVTVLVQVGPATVTLTVRDRGIGIPEAALDRIFQKFERAASSHAYGGLGLGLFISREIAAAHGGSLRAESRPGEGATFTLVLPATPPPAEETP